VLASVTSLAAAWDVRYVPGPAIDEPIGVISASGNRRFFQTDHHGSTIAMVSNAGSEPIPSVVVSIGVNHIFCAVFCYSLGGLVRPSSRLHWQITLF
jgi:hypothetical protein